MAESDDEDGDDRRLPSPSSAKTGFFTVYKKGQGYWTRLGTAICAGLLVLLLGLFIYEQVSAQFGSSFYTPQVVPVGASPEQITAINAANSVGQQHSAQTARYLAVGVTIVLGAVGAIFAWRFMNTPKSVDFLISTDSEMKKVNWTSGVEIWGATRIVIIFLFAIALILFLIDVGAGLLFQWIGLLKFGILG